MKGQCELCDKGEETIYLISDKNKIAVGETCNKKLMDKYVSWGPAVTLQQTLKLVNTTRRHKLKSDSNAGESV